MTRCKLEAAELDKDAPTEAMQTDPICLHNKFTNTQTFSLILSIIYNQWYNLYDGYTRRDWFNILYVAVSWEFEEIQRLTMQQIEIIDNHLKGQYDNNQLTRRFPSPTDTERIQMRYISVSTAVYIPILHGLCELDDSEHKIGRAHV